MPGTEHGRETHQGLRGKSHCARAHRTAFTQGGASGTYWLLSHTAGGIHYCLSFPAKLFVFTWDPQFSSLNTSVWLFPVAFELLINPPPNIYTLCPYHRVDCSLPKDVMAPRTYNCILRSMDPAPRTYRVHIKNWDLYIWQGIAVTWEGWSSV